MDISFDPNKRAKTLQERGLDFADGGQVFMGATATQQDQRKDYGEDRFNTAGYLDGRMVVMSWTPRGNTRRIISMRYCNAKEEERWRQRMG